MSVTISNGALLDTSSEHQDRTVHVETLSVSVLPPILLQVKLPPGYPMYSPPEIVALRTTHHWLPAGQASQKGLLDLWKSGESILYTWIEYLRTGEFLRDMNIAPSTDSDNVISCVSSNQLVW